MAGMPYRTALDTEVIRSNYTTVENSGKTHSVTNVRLGSKADVVSMSLECPLSPQDRTS